MIIIHGSTGGIGRQLLPHLRKHLPTLEAPRSVCDLADASSIHRFYSALAVDAAAPVHIVYAAGISLNGMMHKQDVGEFDRTVGVNLRAPWLILQAAQPLFKSHPGSSMTILSSVVGATGMAGCTAYGASKMALRGLARSACKELGRIECRVNVLELGYFDVGMIGQLSAEAVSNLRGSIPLGRLGRVQEVATAVRFCIDCSYLTGATINLNGGLR